MGLFERLLLLLLLLSAVILKEEEQAAAAASDGPNKRCREKCGDMEIPQPFGLAEGCFRPGFRLICDNGSRRAWLMLGEQASQVELTAVSIDPPGLINVVYYPNISTLNADGNSWTVLKHTPYTFSPGANQFTALGCNMVAELLDLSDTGSSNQVVTACVALCKPDDNLTEALSNGCNGIGCCAMSFPKSLYSYKVQFKHLNSLDYLGQTWSRKNATSWGFIGFQNMEEYSGDAAAAILQGKSISVNAELRWIIRDKQTCKDAQKDMKNYACAANADCQDNNDPSYGQGGYQCFCPPDMEGNPYDKSQGCQGLLAEPGPKCQTRCGDQSIPFPFGIGSGCYRGKGFGLVCNQEVPPKLMYPNSNTTVVDIQLDQGKLVAEENEDLDGMSQDELLLAFKGTNRIELFWKIENVSCTKAKLKKATYACRSKYSECYDAEAEGKANIGYHCKCTQGFEGNPYLSDGCTDIDECKNPQAHGCFEECINEIGSHRCIKRSFVLLGISSFKCKTDPETSIMHLSEFPRGFVAGIVIGISSSIGILLLVFGIYFLNQRWKKSIAMRTKAKHFRKNRGALLKRLLSSDDLAERMKIFSLQEIEKATNNFDETRILGQGGHGTVFKGILSDQRVAAIKKAKIAAQKEIDEFINEVIILSQINHRNVVKLYGCCLESESPLLVYEFVPNGTLREHLEKHSLSWEARLKIATEASGALAHLHRSASISIFHRDVKSSNILLDDNFNAKVSDFGASRSVTHDQSHLTTVVQGTLGYLDPEYYQTGQLTEKSDVYGFGVILVELLTGEKPIMNDRFIEAINIRNHFLSALKENRLFQILENRVKKEGTEEELLAVATIANMCLRLRGEERPTMKEVELKLEGLRTEKRKEHPCYNEDLSMDQLSIDLHELISTAYDAQEKRKNIPTGVSTGNNLTWSLDWPR